MSSTVITCPNPACGKPLNLPAAAVGQSLSCPHCGTGIAVALGPDGRPTRPTVVKALRLSRFVPLAILLTLVITPVVACAGCLWWLLQPSGREIGRYDLGQRRQVRIWSEGEALDPTGLYFQIIQNGTELCRTTHIGVDHGEPFEFRTAFADGGNVACVYEVNRAADDSYYVIIYDAEHRQTWPGDDMDRGMRRELYWKLRAANPDFPRVRDFEQ